MIEKRYAWQDSNKAHKAAEYDNPSWCVSEGDSKNSESDPDLAQVVAAWPTLSEQTKAAILLLLKGEAKS